MDNIVNVSGISKETFKKAVKLCMSDKKALGFTISNEDGSLFKIFSENSKGYIEGFNNFPYLLSSKEISKLFFGYFEKESKKIEKTDFYCFFNISTPEDKNILLSIKIEQDYLTK